MNLGIGFPESIRITGRSRWFGASQSGGKHKYRQALPWLVLYFTFILLLFNAIRLQLVQGPYYRVLSEQNRIKTKVIHAPRGTIYDRDDTALVHNIPGYRQKRQECTSKLPCTQVVGREEMLARKAAGEDISDVEIDSLRQYTKPALFAHVLGYTSETTKDELENLEFKALGYAMGDRVGRGGIEEEYEQNLRGTPGRELIETDATGAQIRVLGKVDPIPGKDITTSLDGRLQEVAYEAMGEKTGAVIVSDPRTGEVFVLISMPSFDSNLFTMGGDYKIQEYLEDDNDSQKGEVVYKTAIEVLSDEENRPLFNRAISGAYPPGSTFKIVTAAAALEEGAIDKDTKIEDTGVLRVGAFSFANWYFTQYGKTEGVLDIVGAIRRSNDIFFYKAAELAGIDTLKALGEKFGLAKTLGIDLPNEASGLFPSDSWKREQIGEPWYVGDTYHVGIGQGYLLTTPLQVNAWTSVIANGGTLCQPTVMRSAKCEVRNRNFLKQETIDLIKEGMRQACDTGGTGWPLFKFRIQNPHSASSGQAKLKIDERNFFHPEEATVSGEVTDWVYIPVACKTGTAEFAVPAGRQGDSKNRTHAWFTAFAPIADPQLAVTVLVEGGGEGSSVAGPIAKKIFEEWFGR